MIRAALGVLSLVGSALGLIRAPQPIAVDIIELNRVYDGEGRLVLTQLIAWSWCRDGRYHVDGWRLVRDKHDSPVLRNGRWVIDVSDGHGRPVEVSAVGFRDTHTQHDPERDDLAAWPQEKRRLK